MDRGLGAAVTILTLFLAWPAAADPAEPAPSPAAQAAAAASKIPVTPPPPAPIPATRPAALDAAPPAVAATASPTVEAPTAEVAPASEPPKSADAVAGTDTADADAAPADKADDQADVSAKPAAQTAAAEPVKPAAPAKASEPAKTAEPTKSIESKDQASAEPPVVVAAKKLFGAIRTPAPMAARAIGTYARGCLAGAKPLAVDGPSWQAMRLSRNRTWGHPVLIALLEKFAGETKQDGWPGLLVGDLSQPRGGPMLTGHASHQLGLDADIWFTPMPDRRLTSKERENLSATSMLASDSLSVNPNVWTESRVKIIKRVASYSQVERVLVHPAIKKALCDATPATADRNWLGKVRPYWGHFYHFHVRIGCPANSPGCKPQAPIPGEDGCGKELEDWYKLLTRKPKPQPKPKEPQIVRKPVKPKPPMSLDELPPECRTVLAVGGEVKVPPPVIASTGGATHTKATATPAAKPAAAKAAATSKSDTPKAAKAKPAATKTPAAKPAEKKPAETKPAKTTQAPSPTKQ